MPLVRIDMQEGSLASRGKAIGDAVAQALHVAMGVPLAERFQIITVHQVGGLSFEGSYLGVRHSPDVIIVQVFLNAGRDVATKRHFYAMLADGLRQAVGLRPEDLVVNLVEVRPEDWSFGNGKAQLA